MSYQEFCNLAENANRQGGNESLRAGNTTLNQGMTYNPKVNSGRAVLTSPERTLKNVWGAAKRSGGFEVGGQSFSM